MYSTASCEVMYCKMDNSFSPNACKIMNMEDEPMSLNLEVYDESSDEGSSGALEIVTSETELGESSGREHKRKRRDNSIGEIPEVLNNMEEEIERQLDAKAAKSNLTVANVKNILKHVITNEHVLAMVRRTIKDDVDVDNENEDEFPYEPKLTRAKAKELLRSQPDIWPITPVKKQSTSKCQVLIDQELSEDSSDEEYRPNEEEQSDEEKENESIASDVDTQPPTPNPPASRLSNDCGTQTSWTEDGLFKIPQENIGQRTRSKLSLSDTPLETIEKAFVPPDITTDMYDSECDDEDWKDFLKNFTEPLTVDVNDTFDDDEADPEYNVLADEEEQTVDKEELRVDRAVKVSRKELNLLVAELFEYADMMSSDDEDPRTLPEVHTSQSEQRLPPEDSNAVNCENQVEMIPPPSNEVPVLEEVLHLSLEQRLLLEQQMRKHVQLTTQHFLQTYAHPQLWQMAGEFKSILVSLKYLAGDNPRSVFCCTNLPDALKLVDIWEKKLSATSPEAVKIISFVQKELNVASEISRSWKQTYHCQFPPQMMELMSQSAVFLYPLLLPSQPFRCVRFARPLHVPSEDSLIAIGLEQFEAYTKANPSTVKASIFPRKSCSRRVKPSVINKSSLTDALPLIHAYLVPTRDARQLYFYIRKAKLIKDNPIQYYYEHNKAPATDHYVIPLTPDMVKPPSKQPKELLPGIWRDYLYSEKSTSDGAPTLLLLRS